MECFLWLSPLPSRSMPVGHSREMIPRRLLRRCRTPYPDSVHPAQPLAFLVDSSSRHSCVALASAPPVGLGPSTPGRGRLCTIRTHGGNVDQMFGKEPHLKFVYAHHLAHQQIVR